MNRICTVCNGSFEITRREYKTTHPDFDLYCSVACLLRFISKGGPDQPIKTVPKPSWMRGIIGKRSSYEEITERFFAVHGIRSAYEPFSLRLVDGRRYIPDFCLPDFNNLMIECKGVWSWKGREKLAKVLEVIPEKSLLLIPEYLIGQMRICLNHPVSQE